MKDFVAPGIKDDPRNCAGTFGLYFIIGFPLRGERLHSDMVPNNFDPRSVIGSDSPTRPITSKKSDEQFMIVPDRSHRKNTHMRKFLCLILLSSTTLVHAASSYAVGLRIVQQYDYSRAFHGHVDPVTGEATTGERARPIQTLIWYPAQHQDTPVKYADYLRTAVTEVSFGDAPLAIDRGVAQMLSAAGVSGGEKRVNDIEMQPMSAFRDAKAIGGKFPVVIYAPSFSAQAAENAELCEFLASQGYVVLASPSMGAHAHDMTSDLAGIEAQAADIEFLIGYAHTLAGADTSRIAVLGYSWGGISNFFAAARDSRISALVDLDGSVRYWPGFVNGGNGAARDVTPARVAVPLLFVGREPDTLEKQAHSKKDFSFSFINEMKYSDVYVVTMHPMRHPDFSSFFTHIARDDQFSEYSRDEVSAAQRWVARYVLNFLDDYLKHDPAAHTFLNTAPVKNGAPPHFISTDIRSATATVQNRDTFAADLAKSGFAHAVDLYDAHHSAAATFELSGDEVNSWGYALMTQGRLLDAIEIFKLGAHVDPKESNAFDSLAEAYENNQNKALAIENYRHSLQLDPRNSHALLHLKQLVGAAPAR